MAWALDLALDSVVSVDLASVEDTAVLLVATAKTLRELKAQSQVATLPSVLSVDWALASALVSVDLDSAEASAEASVDLDSGEAGVANKVPFLNNKSNNNNSKSLLNNSNN